mmetsp:Transcript_41169/g.42069  ORF Transcript_41169/g.42069 Transcript_41169/m.42069 type:complete len:239 (+) Transcript_41169:209-925(+)
MYYSLVTVPLMFSLCIFAGLEILSIIVPVLFGGSAKIPVKGKHLDELESIDKRFIFINKCLTVIFVYHLWLVVSSTPTIKWGINEVSIQNTLGSLTCFYLFYDFFYMLFHRMLHVRSLYGYIHKHHHRQKAPSRGNDDAINVHPFEFVVGEYLHLLTIYLIPCHIYSVVFFILAGGLLASLNHTRYDVTIPFLYSVKVHDVHHRIPDSNYAQYTMGWDMLFGTYRPYINEPNTEKKET